MVFKKILRKRAKKSISVSLLSSVSPEYIILSPIITEKSYNNSDDNKETKKKYFFKVNSRATKVDIKESIKKLYKVSVDKVNVMCVVGKGRANRKVVRKPYKKAVITLHEGQKIDLF